MMIRGASKSFCLTLFAFVLGAACSSGGMGLSSKKYPEGYSLKQPAGWQARVADKTYILVSSPETAKESAFLFIYPFFLKTATPAGLWLDQNLAALAKFFPGAAIEKRQQLRAQPDEWAVKFRFEKARTIYTGLALCSIFERSGVLYVAASKTESFEKYRSTLLTMLQSFQFGEPSAGKGPVVPKVQYVNFSDPAEQAFSLDVPQGWQTQGGTTRRAAVDLVHTFQTVSPDQRIVIQYNDPSIPTFTLPSPTLSFSGFPEGSWYSPGYGVRNLVKRYVPGGQFLVEYLQQNYVPRVEQLEFVSQTDRPDIVEDYNRIYASFQSYGVQVSQHAGEAAFRFRRSGEPYVGYGFALTQIAYMASMQGGNWTVDKLIICTSPESLVDFTQAISGHIFKSLQWNPQWLASQEQLTRNVSQIVTQTNQEITKIISDVHWNRQGVLDNVNRRFSNSTLGVTDVVDPETGQTWKVEAGHNYYWAKPGGGAIVGTNTFTRPDIDFTPLKELR
jgi:hypothetical protein